MADYETNGTLSFSGSPTDESIEIDDWSKANLEKLTQSNGIVRLSEVIDPSTHPPIQQDSKQYSAYENVRPDPDVSNPVLTAGDVTDLAADYIADPFLYVPDSNDSFTDWHMFFEVYTSSNIPISYATSTDQGVTWSYEQVVLDPSDTDLSLPFVFRQNGSYYMLPNRVANDYQPLYKADSFPTQWTEVSQWLSGVSHKFKDHLLFRKDDRWWYLVGTDDGSSQGGVRAYYSDQGIDSIENISSWNAHSQNPVVSGRTSAARGAGRGLIESDGRIIAWFQDCVDVYGDKVRGYEITTLTTTEYADTELSQSPILEGTGSGWNGERMHHYDPWHLDSEGYWRGAVDGDTSNLQEWSIGIYRAGPPGPMFTNRWFYDAGSGSTVTDDVGSYDGTYNNHTWESGAGNGGYFISADGSSTVGNTPTDSAHFGVDTYTAGCWFRADSASSNSIVMESIDTNNSAADQWSIGVGYTTDEVRFKVNQSTNIEISTSINTGTWYFAAFTANASTGDVVAYLGSAADTDLTQVGSSTSYGSANNPGTILSWAAHDYSSGINQYFAGDIDDPVFNSGTAVSQAELESHFDSTKGNY